MANQSPSSKSSIAPKSFLWGSYPSSRVLDSCIIWTLSLKLLIVLLRSVSLWMFSCKSQASTKDWRDGAMAQVFKNAMFADPPYSYLCFSDCANCVISLRSWVHHRKTPRKIPEDSGQEGILSGSWHDSSCTSSVAESCHEACPVQTFLQIFAREIKRAFRRRQRRHTVLPAILFLAYPD